MKHIHIALVGREALPVYYTVAEYKPDLTYLVGTRETRTVVKNLQAVMSTKGLKSQSIEVSPYDVEQTMAKCTGIHEANGEAEYSYNLTGGTKPMAIGAMLCAQRHGARMVYTDAASILDLASFERKPLATKLDNKTLFALQGQKLKGYKVYKFNKEKTNCSKAIKEFILDNKRVYQTLLKQYEFAKKKEVDFDFYEDNNILYKMEDGQLYVELDGMEILSLEDTDAKELLFEGRWWETLVADWIARWAKGKYEIWTSVKFMPNTVSSDNDKNEIDILVNIGHTLLFVECKSGNFVQENIYKLNSICKNYGSYKSRGAIVSFWPVNRRPELLEKAKEDDIDIIALSYGNPKSLEPALNEIINSLKA